MASWRSTMNNLFIFTTSTTIFTNIDMTACVRLLYVLVATAPVAHGFLFLDLFGDNDAILFARVRCFMALWRTGFDIGDFENYSKNFRDHSVMELAQAGAYKGASQIEEYVKFVFPSFSPYITCCDSSIQNQIKFLGYENGQCEFLNLLEDSYELDLTTTNAIPSNSKFRLVYPVKLYLDFEQGYVSRLNIFYTDDFLQTLFDTFLNSANTRKYICGIVNGQCSTILSTTVNETHANNVTCEDQLATLPSTNGQFYFDGKSQGCRALHAVLAAGNPKNHCAHLSFTPLDDPNGNIKCQTSKNVLPSTLFTDRELQMYEYFAESVGIDPKIGYTFIE